ncbi:MAG: hypothetical protein AAF560_31655, partial [Acidobacteriota bacterium]
MGKFLRDESIEIPCIQEPGDLVDCSMGELLRKRLSRRIQMDLGIDRSSVAVQDLLKCLNSEAPKALIGKI